MKFNHSSDESIGIRIHNADLAITSCVRKYLKPFNLAPEQNLIMTLLWEQDGITFNEFASMLKKDKAGITRMIASLEGKGFIKKVDNPTDKRTFKVYLTDEGKLLAHLVRPVRQKIIEIVAAGITKEESDQLQMILDKIVNTVSMDNERSRPADE